MVLVVIGVVVVVGIVIALFGWDRYRGSRRSPGDGTASQPTGEVFVDPDSGRRMRVWYDRGTGRREYRPEQPSDAELGAGALTVASPRVPPATRSGAAQADTHEAIKATGLTKRFGE